MKKIGIIGGAGWHSSLVYYQKMNEMVAQQLGEMHSAKLALVQTDFEIIERYQRESRWDEIAVILSDLGHDLKKAGADFFLIASNTLHVISPIVEASVDLPFIHIVDTAAKKIIENGYKKTGLLGTRYTMSEGYFTKRLEDIYKVNVLLPDEASQKYIHDAIFDELVKGIIKETTHAKFREVINDLAQRGAEVIILGCTEFGMLIKQEDSPVPIVDTTIEHIEAAVKAALN